MLMPEQGYDARTCQDFDFAVEHFDAWYEQRANATVQVPAPKHSGPQMTSEPKYPSLLDVLGLGDMADDEQPLTPDEQALVDALASGSLDLPFLFGAPEDP